MAITRGSIFLVACLCGCATSTSTTGLSNAPKLGTSPSHERPPYDVVADGKDSCERAPTEQPPAWSRSPPCAAIVVPAPALFAEPSPPPARSWLPRSRWSLPACASSTTSEPALRPASYAACCAPGDVVCAR